MYINHINSYSTDQDIQDALNNGTLGKTYVALNESTGEIDWNSKEQSPDAKYFTIEVISAGTITFNLATGVNMMYSPNGGKTWHNNTTINAQPGDIIIYKGTNSALYNSLFDFSNFYDSTATFKASGNIMSLFYGDNFFGQTTFQSNTERNVSYLFTMCSGLVDASDLELPATALTSHCYSGMFDDCWNLTAAPKTLPATVLAYNCYGSMFRGCTGLTAAPELPATTLEENSYSYMFSGCTALNHIKCLATSLGYKSTYKWVDSVAAYGTFVKNPDMSSWTTGVDGIPV